MAFTVHVFPFCHCVLICCCVSTIHCGAFTACVFVNGMNKFICWAAIFTLFFPENSFLLSLPYIISMISILWVSLQFSLFANFASSQPISLWMRGHRSDITLWFQPSSVLHSLFLISCYILWIWLADHTKTLYLRKTWNFTLIFTPQIPNWF